MILKNCLVCGKEFKVKPYKLKIGKGKYCSKACCMTVTSLKGWGFREKHWNWKGGRHLNTQGYFIVKCKFHPSFGSDCYVKEHRLIVEKEIGRYLKKDEHVHHINGIRTDNRLENLHILSCSEHTSIHNKLNWKIGVFARAGRGGGAS